MDINAAAAAFAPFFSDLNTAMWISLIAATGAILAAIFALSMAVSAHKSRPDKGEVVLRMVGRSGYNGIHNDIWEIQNSGRGIAIDPEVEFKLPEYGFGTVFNAAGAGHVPGGTSLRLTPAQNWPSPNTPNYLADGVGSIWDGVIGTVRWLQPGRKDRVRSAPIELTIDRTPPEVVLKRNR